MEKPTVLIVDDEPVVRESLSAWLEDDGFKVFVSQDGLSALNLLKGESVDVAVLDVKMPGMDGVTLLSKIRGIYQELPVIIITAHGSIENAVHAMKEGAYDYIMKPFPPEKLSNVLRRVLEYQKLTRENIQLKKERKQILFITMTALVSIIALVIALYTSGTLSIFLHLVFLVSLAGLVLLVVKFFDKKVV